ncbi:MAG: sugar ABC transporter substrate-binding protein [Bowdeniella nasicola]|nr:sugar ABC transporter substrate-binding protein [Bowdeniella nasicola]
MRRFPAVALAASLAVTLVACSPGAGKKEEATGKTTVTFRLWDENAAKAYEESFEAFTSHNPDIQVKVEVVGWNQYWEQLPLDIQSGEMADIFWTNSSSYAKFADNGNLIDIGQALGSDHDEWVPSTAELYERNGKLWGVPQIWDSIALFYNRDLVEKAGVDPASLTWMPEGGDGDTLLPAARALTFDDAGRHPGDNGFNPDSRTQFGFNAQADLQAIYLDWLAEAGATFQGEDDQFAFASPQGEQAFQYLVDMANTHHVAPAPAETNQDGDLSRKLFVQGKLALFQSGPYSLPEISENAEFNWAIAPMVAGPEGRVSVVHAVAAVGNSASKNVEATTKVLKWLASADGQAALASSGAAFPAVVDAQDDYVKFWKDKGVDVTAFQEAAKGATTKAPVGAAIDAGLGAIGDPIKEIFLGTTPVPDGLKKAQESGNTAMK